MTRSHLFGGLAFFSVALLFSAMAVRAQVAAKAPAQPNPTATAGKSHADNEGQRVFDQNCSRCHNAPEGFSQHVSGTVARHMRVRAQLSDHDYQELLHFLNP